VFVDRLDIIGGLVSRSDGAVPESLDDHDGAVGVEDPLRRRTLGQPGRRPLR
jgi:hypothetical protein